MTRRAWLLGGLAGTAALFAGSSANTWRARISRRDVFLPSLPHGWDGVRVLHLTDFHRGPYVGEYYLGDCVRLARAIPHDMVVLTGDYVSRNASGISDYPRWFEGWQPSLGSWAVLGNHDHYTDPDWITQTLTGCGVRVLRNQSVRVDHRGEGVRLIGLGDAASRHHNVREAMRDTRPGEFLWLLSHTPGMAWESTQLRIDFMMSGHTHGGQVCLPGGKALFAANHLGPRYAAGLFRMKDLVFYVNRGLGVVFLPVRFFCPPEIAILTLKRGTAPPGVFDDETDTLS